MTTKIRRSKGNVFRDLGFDAAESENLRLRSDLMIELSKLIHSRSGGKLSFHVDSLYPLLYRLEERGWIKGIWVEKTGERRRRFYRVTAEGRRVLARQRKTWAAFVEAMRRVTGGEHA